MKNSDDPREDEIAFFVAGRCVQFIEGYADSCEIPAHLLANRVKEILLGHEDWGAITA